MRIELEAADREFQSFKSRDSVGRLTFNVLIRALLPQQVKMQNQTTAGNGGSVAMQSMAAKGRGDDSELRVGVGREARPTAFTKEFLARQAEMQNRTVAGNKGSMAMQSTTGRRRGDDDEEKLIGGQPQRVPARKRNSIARIFFGKLYVPQEPEAQKGKTRMGVVQESATARGRGDRDEEALVGGEPEVGVQMGVPVKTPTWGSEAPPAYSSLPPEDHEHEDDLHSDTDQGYWFQ